MNKQDSARNLTQYLRSKGRSKNTIRAYCTDLEQYFDWVADTYAITDASWHDLALMPHPAQHYINGLRSAGTLSASTINRRISTIRCFARAQGVSDPLPDYDGPSRTRPPAHPLPGLRGDLETLIDHALTVEQKTIVALCGMVGLRISEARSVRVSSIKYVAGQPYMRVTGKGDKRRDVPIAPRPFDIIMERVNELNVVMIHTPEHLRIPDPFLIDYSDRGARQAYTAMGRRAGINTATHDARMTFGTMVYNTNKDIRATQALLGHASIETTVGYTGVADQAMISAVGVFA